MTDNELIAEFMGFKKDAAGLYLMHIHAAGRHSSLFRPDQVAYNTSWDWLMPVVQNIEEIEEPHPSNNPEKGTIWPYQFEILSRNTVQVIDNRTDECIVTINDDECTKIQSVYKAVVEFIKWYNSNHPQP